MPQIVFAARLTEADWDETLRGWRCPALAVPGAIVEALYVEGNKADTAKYEVLREHHVIRWTPSDQPQRVTASITLTEELTLGAETDRWKKLAIVLPVVATIASAGLRTPLIYQTGPNTSVKSGCSCSICEKRCISGRSHCSRMVGIREVAGFVESVFRPR